MIFIGLGANLPSEEFGPPRATCGAALAAIAEHEIAIARWSRWYHSAPVPASDQPWYVNGLAEVETSLGPEELFDVLMAVERRFGRRRGEKNAARILDLDLIAYHDAVIGNEDDGEEPLCVPHPRLSERAFVVLPLAELAPDWRHPRTGASIRDLAGAVANGQSIEAMADGDGLYGTEWLG